MFGSARVSAGIFGLLLVGAALPAFAQWSSDPAVNLTIADRSGGQVQPKLVASADGGFYTSWFGNGSDGYDVYLQRLDAGGVEQWAHNGIQVADRSFSSTQDYGLAIAPSGDALLAFRFDDGVNGTQIAASKVAADGTPQWGSPGIIVSADSGGANSPRIAPTDDGGAFVAWSGSDGSIVVQKLDATGGPQWGAGIVLVPPSGFFLLADLRAAGDGAVIASWSAQLSTFDRELWAQKFASADGSALWGADPVKVFDGSSGALQFGYFPKFLVDGSGGAVFVWYSVNLAGTVHAQHILDDGSPAFAQNGVEASTDTTRTHTEPAGAYDASTGDIYAIWRVADAASQSQIGVNAQRIDASGARQWTDSGKVLVAQTALDQSQVGALALNGGALFSWASNDQPNPVPIHVTRLDTVGDFVWPAQVVDIKTGASDSSRLVGALSASVAPFAAYAWEDGTGGAGEGVIKAQNIDFDGVLGPPVADLIFADGFELP